MNWLRARSGYHRAKEERTLVELEMDWTVRYFRHYAEKWAGRKILAISPGHNCYAAKTEAMWAMFALRAYDAFSKSLQAEVTPVS